MKNRKKVHPLALLEKAVDGAQARLDRAIDEHFPVGCLVAARHGRGWMDGKVWTNASRGCVRLQTWRGGKHDRHWSDCRRIDQ